MAAPLPVTHFLELPIQIRLQIYGYLFASIRVERRTDASIPVSPRPSSSPPTLRKLALLVTCKQTQQELDHIVSRCPVEHVYYHLRRSIDIIPWHVCDQLHKLAFVGFIPWRPDTLGDIAKIPMDYPNLRVIDTEDDWRRGFLALGRNFCQYLEALLGPVAGPSVYMRTTPHQQPLGLLTDRSPGELLCSILCLLISSNITIKYKFPVYIEVLETEPRSEHFPPGTSERVSVAFKWNGHLVRLPF
jgi:hypothetical protein